MQYRTEFIQESVSMTNKSSHVALWTKLQGPGMVQVSKHEPKMAIRLQQESTCQSTCYLRQRLAVYHAQTLAVCHVWWAFRLFLAHL